MPEDDPVYVEPPEGFYEHNDTVWCLKRTLNGLRDASRLLHEHFADVHTSRLGFSRSEAQPTLFVDLARNVFIAVHVDDLIMVGSSSQLYEVVGEMKQYFTMMVTHPLSVQFHTDLRGCTVLATRRRRLGVADHTICDRHAERTRHEGCKTCGHCCCESQQ